MSKLLKNPKVQKAFNAIFSKTGFHVVKRPRYNGSTQFKIDDFSYGVATPAANYAPWLGDVEFQAVYTRIRQNTLVDIYRCYELWEIVEATQKLDNTASLLEVGVWKGGTAGIIGRKLELLKSKSPFYIADTFAGVAKASDKDKFYVGGEHSDTNQGIVEALLKDTYKNYKILKGIFPEDTQHLVPAKEKFGFCHIDVDVYDSAKDIVDWIWDRLIIGGSIVFDDYGFHTCNGVTRYVNEQKALTDRVIIHNLNGHAIMVKMK
jgi:O-methyltransferase